MVLYRKKSCSSYGPIVSSVDCSISPLAAIGSSSGGIVVPTIESRVSRTGPASNSCVAAYSARNSPPRAALNLGRRRVLDEELDERLGDRAVGVVHAHVVAVVGAPPQRQ